jgi:hypothetical protein
MFMDIRSGSQLIVVVAPEHNARHLFDPTFFSLPRYYLPGFERGKVENKVKMEPEAVLLTEGMRM